MQRGVREGYLLDSAVQADTEPLARADSSSYSTTFVNIFVCPCPIAVAFQQSYSLERSAIDLSNRYPIAEASRTDQQTTSPCACLPI